jgi:hypothetical protein
LNQYNIEFLMPQVKAWARQRGLKGTEPETLALFLRSQNHKWQKQFAAKALGVDYVNIEGVLFKVENDMVIVKIVSSCRLEGLWN